MKNRTRCWTKRSSKSLKTKLRKAGFKKVAVTFFGDTVEASFDMVYPGERRKADKIGERMGMVATGGGSNLACRRSDVTWQIRWRKTGRKR